MDHINKTSAMLEDFNSSTVFEEKIKKSEILEQDYLEFKVRLENIKPPSIAAGAYAWLLRLFPAGYFSLKNLMKMLP